MTDLGRLERVKLRDIWENEAQHFTPWLAQEENLSILGDTIKIDLELEAQEKNVGPFSADILCKDTATGNWVLVENQLERTDHTHLGQLLTYAAGLQAVTIVWVSARFTEEHRAALDWLNEITDDRISFFGLEVELWRIGESLAAPKFNIISKPNDWSRSVGSAARRIEDQALSPTQELYLRYWAAFRDFLINSGSSINPVKPTKENWTSYGVGRTGFGLAATINQWEKRIRVEIYIGAEDAKSFFALLKKDQAEIEKEFGGSLDWQELPEAKASRIALALQPKDPADEDDWPKQHEWMQQKLELLDRTFRHRIRTLSLEPDEKTVEG